jgi:DNA-binding transcriptional regulator YhcF (GntR family)
MKFDETKPIYLQIKEEIENAIISGAIKEDDVIPSIRVLAQQYRLNPQTVSNAVSELLNEGYLYKKRGIGMFVQAGSRTRLKDRRGEEFRTSDIKKVIIKGRSLGINRNDLIKIIDSVYEQEDRS